MGLGGVEMVDPKTSSSAQAYAKAYLELRRRKGVTLQDARLMVRDPQCWGR